MPREYVPTLVVNGQPVPVITLGFRARFRFDQGEVHFHHCPNCYEDGPCAMECEFEEDCSDLEEDGYRERLRGSPVACDACRIFEGAA